MSRTQERRVISPPAERKPAHRAQRSERSGGFDGLAAYLDAVGHYPVMSREEEHEVAVKFKETGDKKLADRLVTSNLRLVLKIALEYRGVRRHLTDLVQEGNLGLLHAVGKYDPNRGVKLATYAAWWIRAYMLKFMLSNARLVKLGTTQAQRRLFFGLRRTRARLEGNGGEVGVEQLAASLSVSQRDVEEMERRMSTAEASLDRPLRDGDGRTFADALPAEGVGPESKTEDAELHGIVSREVEAFRRGLKGRELVLLKKRLVCEETTTLAEIASEFGVSRERVRQLEDRLKARLREHLRTKLGDAVPAAA
jgi:RNA polymerase sigma-32 factor